MKILSPGGRTVLVYAAVVAAVTAISIAVALLVTPMQQVAIAGQTVSVGAAAPSLSFSGSGELDLFGQRLPTAISFLGPVRPRLALTNITLGQQIGSLFSSHRHTSPFQAIRQALAAARTRYFGGQSANAAAAAVLPAAAGTCSV